MLPNPFNACTVRILMSGRSSSIAMTRSPEHRAGLAWKSLMNCSFTWSSSSRRLELGQPGREYHPGNILHLPDGIDQDHVRGLQRLLLPARVECDLSLLAEDPQRLGLRDRLAIAIQGDPLHPHHALGRQVHGGGLLAEEDLELARLRLADQQPALHELDRGHVGGRRGDEADLRQPHQRDPDLAQVDRGAEGIQAEEAVVRLQRGPAA